MKGFFKNQRKKISLDCFGAKRLSDLLFWPGVGLAIFCGYLWEWTGNGRFGIGVAAGFVLIAAGTLTGWLGVVCPRCGAPLYEFPKLPRHVPQYCPRCGEKITEEADE